jgi:hypothetical protein
MGQIQWVSLLPNSKRMHDRLAVLINELISYISEPSFDMTEIEL